MIKATPAKVRFWKYAEPDETDLDNCWLWQGCIDPTTGYGVIRESKKNLVAHRVSWEIHYGPIPEHPSYHGMCVLHSCDRRDCWNPTHLFLGTNYDNIQDKVRKGRMSKAPRPVGEQSGMAKLKNEDVREIRKLFTNGILRSDLARQFKVTHSNIDSICKGCTWRHLL